MKNYLYIILFTLAAFACVQMVHTNALKNQEGIPSLLFETKTVKDSIYKQRFDHSGFDALLQKM